MQHVSEAVFRENDRCPSNRCGSQTCKIMEIVSSMFHALSEVFYFPARYLGSKTWSIPGVIVRMPTAIFQKIFSSCEESLSGILFAEADSSSSSSPHRLTANETSPYMRYFFTTHTVHGNDPSWSIPFGYSLLNTKELNVSMSSLSRSLESKETCFFDTKTGFKAAFLENNDEIVIAFGAVTSCSTELKDPKQQNQLNNKMRWNVIQNLIGFKPSIFREAEDFMRAFMAGQNFKDKKIILTGKCYGGTLASYLGLKLELPAYCFNSVPLGPGLQQEIGKTKLRIADRYITHISAEHDFVSDPYLLDLPDRFLSILGIRTAGNFGRRLKVPSAYATTKDTHDHLAGSMMHHLGFNRRAKPADIERSHPMFH